MRNKLKKFLMCAFSTFILSSFLSTGVMGTDSTGVMGMEKKSGGLLEVVEDVLRENAMKDATNTNSKDTDFDYSLYCELLEEYKEFSKQKLSEPLRYDFPMPSGHEHGNYKEIQIVLNLIKKVTNVGKDDNKSYSYTSISDFDSFFDCMTGGEEEFKKKIMDKIRSLQPRSHQPSSLNDKPNPKTDPKGEPHYVQFLARTRPLPTQITYDCIVDEDKTFSLKYKNHKEQKVNEPLTAKYVFAGIENNKTVPIEIDLEFFIIKDSAGSAKNILATIKKDNKEMEKLLSQLCKTAANSKFLKGKIHRRLLHIPDDDTRGEGRRLLNKKGILLFLPELRCYSIANDGKTVECLNASKSRYDFGIFCKENVKNILNIKMPETSDAETEDEMHDSSSFDAYGTPYIYPATLTFTCQFSPFNEKSCYYDLDGIDCKEREENRSKLEALSKANATYDSAKATAECDGIKTANMKKLSEESKE